MKSIDLLLNTEYIVDEIPGSGGGGGGDISKNKYVIDASVDGDKLKLLKNVPVGTSHVEEVLEVPLSSHKKLVWI